MCVTYYIRTYILYVPMIFKTYAKTSMRELDLFNRSIVTAYLLVARVMNTREIGSTKLLYIMKYICQFDKTLSSVKILKKK